jgi:hypothetical protein
MIIPYYQYVTLFTFSSLVTTSSTLTAQPQHRPLCPIHPRRPFSSQTWHRRLCPVPSWGRDSSTWIVERSAPDLLPRPATAAPSSANLIRTTAGQTSSWEMEVHLHVLLQQRFPFSYRALASSAIIWANQIAEESESSQN